MSALRVPVSALLPGTLRLDKDAARYVTRVHRLGPNKTFVGFDPVTRTEADVTVTGVTGRRVTCSVGELRPASHVVRCMLWLLQGLTKADAFDRIVRDATALGVTDLVPVTCARSMGSVAGKAALRLDRWKRIAVQASRQCGRGDVPRIVDEQSLLKALSAIPQDAIRLCLSPAATAPMREALSHATSDRPMVVLIGPEGGFDPDEIAQAAREGFAVVSMGSSILRTDTAATAVLGAILAMRT